MYYKFSVIECLNMQIRQYLIKYALICIYFKKRYLSIESLSPTPSGRPPWDLISEKYCMVVNGERQQIF